LYPVDPIAEQVEINGTILNTDEKRKVGREPE
jgi:hypothetical protein